MKVVILTDYIKKAVQMWQKVRVVDGCKIHILICNNQNLPFTKFIKSQLGSLKQSDIGFFEAFKLIEIVLSGRIKISLSSIHDEDSLQWLEKINPDVGLHGMGVIYRKKAIDKFSEGILNAHIGKLPEYRGRSVLEWTILKGDQPGITCFFIDEGIDTGDRILFFESFDLCDFEGIEEAKQYLFKKDAEIYKKGIEFLRQENPGYKDNHLEDGDRYFVTSNLFRDTAGAILDQNNSAKNNKSNDHRQK